eukprot:Gb_15272 [translate_table: standard]
MPISLIRADNNLPPMRPDLEEVFDAIICDPPYGVCGGGRKSSGRKLLKGVVGPYVIPADKRRNHIPSTTPYSWVECVHDLLDIASRMLVMGGRLVFFYPVARDEQWLPKRHSVGCQWHWNYSRVLFHCASFLSSSLWKVYGALSKDIVIIVPNFLGVPLGLAQIVVCFGFLSEDPHCASEACVGSCRRAESDALKSHRMSLLVSKSFSRQRRPMSEKLLTSEELVGCSCRFA